MKTVLIYVRDGTENELEQEKYMEGVATAIGEEVFICRWWDKSRLKWDRESGNTTLNCRDWKKVGSTKGSQQ